MFRAQRIWPPHSNSRTRSRFSLRNRPESRCRLLCVDYDYSEGEKAAGNISRVLGVWGRDRGLQGALRSPTGTGGWKAHAVVYNLYDTECSSNKFVAIVY